RGDRLPDLGHRHARHGWIGTHQTDPCRPPGIADHHHYRLPREAEAIAALRWNRSPPVHEAVPRGRTSRGRRGSSAEFAAIGLRRTIEYNRLVRRPAGKPGQRTATEYVSSTIHAA